MLGQVDAADYDRIAGEGARTVPPREHGGNCDMTISAIAVAPLRCGTRWLRLGRPGLVWNVVRSPPAFLPRPISAWALAAPI
nr:acetamidase/formamidase family protein [Leptolyngbya sp. BC1307]